MDRNGMITMSMRQLERFKIVLSVVDGVLKPWCAAEQFKLTPRQVSTLISSSLGFAGSG